MLLYQLDSQSYFICLQCGLILGTMLLFASSYASKKSCSLLLRSAQISRKRDFESLGRLAKFMLDVFGSSIYCVVLFMCELKLTRMCLLVTFTGFHVGGFLGKLIVEMRLVLDWVESFK